MNLGRKISTYTGPHRPDLLPYDKRLMDLLDLVSRLDSIVYGMLQQLLYTTGANKTKVSMRQTLEKKMPKQHEPTLFKNSAN